MFIVGYYVGAIMSAERAQRERAKEKPLPTYEEVMSWEEENSRDTMSIIEDSIVEWGKYEICITTYSPMKGHTNIYSNESI